MFSAFNKRTLNETTQSDCYDLILYPGLPGIRNHAVLIALAVLSLLIHSQTIFADQLERPNIVIILADDMGFGDVQALNPSSNIPTPNLNQLAADGMTFTDAHTPSAVCTPTRYGVVTGRYCWRTSLKRGVLNGYGEPLIQDDRLTIAEFLKDNGYATGVVGKWHLGLGFAKDGDQFDFSKPVSDGPHTHGFDYSYIIPASLDFPPYVYIENGNITEYPELTQQAQKFPAFLRKGERSPDLVMENVLDDIATQAEGFIAKQASQSSPFFLYLPLTAPHKPVLPHPRFQNQTDLGPYGDFVHQVDATVGNILKSIDDAGVRENTIVVYTSDNGSYMYRLKSDEKDHIDEESVQGYRPEHHTANADFRGTKADVWEGGHHVPFFVRWPAQIKSGIKSKETICLTDLFATAADVINKKLPEGAAPDSFSLLTLLKGETRKTPRAPVIHHSANGIFAIRDGEWKLVLGNGSGGRQAPKGNPFEQPYFLFNMQDDPAETKNVIESHPEIAKRLEAECLKIRDSGSSKSLE